MSNINNKHIPEDLDSLTRKDMVELFKIQIEEHQGFIKEIESLREQLAKANKRENRLEKILQRYESEQLQPLKLRVKELEEFKSALASSEETGFIDLNKLAIENQIEGYVEGFIRGYKQCEDDMEIGNWTDEEESLVDYARDFSEELRKEQSND